MSLLAALFPKNSHILAGIYFIFLEKVPDQTRKSFYTKFGPQRIRKLKHIGKQEKQLSRKTNFSTFLLLSCFKFRLKLSLHKKIFLVLSGTMIFFFLTNIILFFRLKMKDDLSQKNRWKYDISSNVLKRWSFQNNCTGI